MDRAWNEAEAKIKTWAHSQKGLLDGWYISPGKNSHTIRWEHPEFGNTFILMRVALRKGRVVCVNDFRKRVKLLLKNPQGFAREARLFKLLMQPSVVQPSWFVEIKRAHVSVDRRGIDGFAKICLEEGRSKRVKLPFQVKSNRHDAKLFFEQYPSYVGVVSIIIVKDDDTDLQLQTRAYSTFGEVRSRMIKEGLSVKDFKKKITEGLSKANAA